MAETLRIGTRGSPLALHQAEQIRGLIESLSDGSVACEVRTFTTTGDRLTTERLIESGGKGLFTKELDVAMDAGEIDIAVHSLKDVPSVLPEGQDIVAVAPREDPREGFICQTATALEDLPGGAVLGTASIRREAQTRLVRPDLEIVPFRGNVQTRLKKLEAGEASATYLAMAGLSRLGLQHLAHPIELEDMLPAPCQGIVAVTAIPGRLSEKSYEALKALSDPASERAAAAERAFLMALDGSCRTPISGHLFEEEGAFRFVGEVTAPDGTAVWDNTVFCSENSGTDDLAAAGSTAAESILEALGGQLPHVEG
ncbi:MAG: hydroxymethylbilane synthase, partial [Pseudomonadota bacterium]